MTLNCTTSIHDVKLIDSPWHDFKRHHVLGMTIKGSQKQTPDQALREEAFQESSDLWLETPVDLTATAAGSATRSTVRAGNSGADVKQRRQPPEEERELQEL